MMHTIRTFVRLLPVVLICALGCGGNDAANPLPGTAWTWRISGLLCDQQDTFYADGQYLDTITCQLGDKSHVAQVKKGTYGVDGHTLMIAINESSCATAASGSIDFAVSGDSLILAMSDANVITMTRLIFLPGEPQGIPIGCFDAVDWSFEAMALHPL